MVKMAVKYPQHLQAVVNSCGLIHSTVAPLQQRTDLEGNPVRTLPESILSIAKGMSYQVFVKRIGMNTGADVQKVFEASTPISLIEQGVLTGEIVTPVPILSINTHFDPLVPYSDTVAASVASENGEIWFRGEFGHCSPGTTDPEVYEWIKEKIL